MKRNITFDKYEAENTFYSPSIVKNRSKRSHPSSIKDQFKEKEDITRNISKIEKSGIYSEDY